VNTLRSAVLGAAIVLAIFEAWACAKFARLLREESKRL
jgi:hypothetical protein